MRTVAQELVRKDKKLECNEECSQLERNKRMALALQIRHQHTSSFLLANHILNEMEFCFNFYPVNPEP
jgi:hypothetical protein